MDETFPLGAVSQRMEEKVVRPMSIVNVKPVVGCLFLLGLSSPAFCQPSTCPDTSSDRAAIQSLTSEVRQLRMMIEKSAPVISRMSVLLMRFPRQDDKVERLTQELESVRSRITANTSQKEALLASMRELDSQSVPSDPSQREELQIRKKTMAAQLEQLAANEQQCRGLEIELSSRLQKEQAILADLTAQLDAIDKKLQLFQ